ncbi:MAG TPA: type VI secretion system tip protein TssI/VgrG [Orrella sp.]
MATSEQAQQPRFEFKLQAKPDAVFHVTEIQGDEAISEPYVFKIVFGCSDFELQADDFLLQPALLKIFTTDGESCMNYSGLVFEFALLRRVNNYVLYEVVLRPRIWKMSLNRITDVYCEEKTVPELIAQKLREAGLTDLNFEQRLKDSSVFRKRSLVCQFYETDLAFISRYMEAEGIYYFFDQSEEFNERLIMVDYRQAQTNSMKALYYFDTENMPTDMQDNRVTNLTMREQVTTGKVVVQDFNYRKAALEDTLKSDVQVNPRGYGTTMFWGYNLREVKETERMAMLRKQELLCHQFSIDAETTAIDVYSAAGVALQQHYQSALNRDYLVVRATHAGRQAYAWFEGSQLLGERGSQVGTYYRCKFKGVDHQLQYRSPRKTPWPFISGTLSGIVDDESEGKYAQLNDYGQYKVQFLFDLTDKNPNRGSSWVRMASVYSGQGHGMAFPLLKGTEVVIGFMGGDPDQPIILGAVPNSENPNVLNANNSHLGGFQTDSGNYLVTNDTRGQEGVHMWSPGSNTHFYIGKF